MSDDQVLELIIAQLDKVAEESAPGAGNAAAYVDQMTSGVQVAGQMLLRAFESNDRFRVLPGLIWQQLTDNGKVSGWFLLFQLDVIAFRNSVFAPFWDLPGPEL